MQKLKNIEAPGPGNLPAELVKNGTPKVIEHITKLFQKCINGEQVPNEWKLFYLTLTQQRETKSAATTTGVSEPWAQ